MRSAGDIGKPLVIGLLLAIALYAGGFLLDQHLRTRRGPWVVTFATEPSGDAMLLVNQPRLGVSNLRIVLAGETTTNPAATISFDVPERAVPSGEVIFEDLTYLPGTVTFRIAGHEIELLPRTLYLNRKPFQWESDARLVLHPTDKLPADAPRRKTQRP